VANNSKLVLRPLEYCGVKKTRMMGLPDGEKTLRICTTV